MARRLGQLGEAIPLALVCLSPWAFGSVTAWAECALYLGILLVTLLGAATGRGDRWRSLTSVPSLAMAGLVLLALTQASAWPGRLMGRVAPSTVAFERSLGPGVPSRVLGDPGQPVEPPGTLLSVAPEMTIDTAVRLAAGWALFQAVIASGRRPGSSARLGIALAANAALLALFAVIQMLSWNGRMFWVLFEMSATAHGGPFVNRNHLAAYLNLGLGFALAPLIASRPEDGHGADRGRWLASAYAAGLIVVGILASLSRGGFVAMVAATAATIAIARPRSGRIAGGLVIMMGLVAVFLWGVGGAESYRRLATLSGSGAFDSRIACWAAALRAWRSQPTWGLGLGTFADSSARFFDHYSPTVFVHAENDYLEALAEGGVIAFALALVILGSLVRMGLGVATSPDPRRQWPALGALFGLFSLAIHSLSDFPVHNPAIAVTAVALAAHLVGGVLDARRPRPEPTATLAGRARGAIAALIPIALALPAAWHGFERARSENALLAAGIPRAGTDMPSTTLWDAPMPTLEQAAEHLEAALRYRPDWAEGHARLGLLRLSQYRAAALGLVAAEAGSPDAAKQMADPLWLHGVVHSAPPEALASAGGVLGHEPVRRYLVPAARSFLEARRCSPAWGLPHAELASLDYLIPGIETTSDHARRALALAGNDTPTLATAARAASQAGDLRLAAGCWRKILLVGEAGWPSVADQARAILTPRQILDWVVPDGRYALRFADRLFEAPEDRPVRNQFLEWAIDRLPRDREPPEADRLRFEAQAQARLGRAGLAEERMTAALSLEPGRSAWRAELVEWLIGWGKFEEAHDQALLGIHLAPSDPEANRAVELAAEALARASRHPGAPKPR